MVQQLRTIWEPLPFCIRYAGIISMFIGALSTALFLLHFRRSALRLRDLVEEHFDPVHGAPDRCPIFNRSITVAMRLAQAGPRTRPSSTRRMFVS